MAMREVIVVVQLQVMAHQFTGNSLITGEIVAYNATAVGNILLISAARLTIHPVTQLSQIEQSSQPFPSSSSQSSLPLSRLKNSKCPEEEAKRP